MNEVAAIVVTYNRKELLKECIEKLKEQTYPLDILVIDNASTDGTGDMFIYCDKNIHYFNTGSNLGGAGGFNYGMKRAYEMGYDYFWLMDDDTMPTKTALEMFIKKDKILNGKYGFLTSKVLWKDESICTMNIQKITKWKKMVNFEDEQIIQYASFVSFFMKSTQAKQSGFPYKDFFIWADDWEYSRRISKMEKCYFIPESIVHHWSNNNVGANIVNSDIERMGRFKYMYRNDVVLYRQDGIEGIIYLKIRNAIHIIRILMKGRNVKQKIKIIKQASIEGKKFHPIIEYPQGD